MREKAYYAKGFKHGALEHKFERWTTYLLLLSSIIMFAGLIIRYEILAFYIVIFLILFATLFRLMAWHHHKREKYWHTKAHATPNVNRVSVNRKKSLFRRKK